MKCYVPVISATLCTCVLLFSAPTVAGASPILFSNFGPSLSYNTTDGNPVGNDGFGGLSWLGETFSPSVTATLGTIELALSDADTSKDPITVNLMTSVSDSPGAILESFTIPGGTAGPLGSNNPVFTLTSLAHPLLTVGTQYWLTVAAPGTSAYVWNFNSTGANGDHAISSDGGSTWFVAPSGFFTPGAFEVDGITAGPAVPEPGTLLLVVSGVGMLARRRLASRTRH